MLAVLKFGSVGARHQKKKKSQSLEILDCCNQIKTLAIQLKVF
jgi:hypothetical protein